MSLKNKPLRVKSLPVLSQCLLHNVYIMILTNSSQLIWRSSSPSTPAARIISSTYSPWASLRGWSCCGKLRTRDQIAAVHVEHVDLKLSSSESVIFILLASHQLKELGEVNGSVDVYDHVLGLGL